MIQHTKCLVVGALLALLTARASGAEPAPRATEPKLSPPSSAAATPAPAVPTPAVPASGTYIHVKNGTNRSLKFSLYVECAGEGTGRFDKEFLLQPGEVGIWRLNNGHKIATATHNGSKLYRLGLIGTDPQGVQHRWGTIGGNGMVGNEHKSSPGRASNASYRHILVRPAGDL